MKLDKLIVREVEVEAKSKLAMTKIASGQTEEAGGDEVKTDRHTHIRWVRKLFRARTTQLAGLVAWDPVERKSDEGGRLMSGRGTTQLRVRGP